MNKKKKESIRIIKREDINKKDYTFVSNDNILNNIKNNNEPTTIITTTNNEKKFDIKPNVRIEKKKIHSKKSQDKGRKTIGKSMQGHSPIYE